MQFHLRLSGSQKRNSRVLKQSTRVKKRPLLQRGVGLCALFVLAGIFLGSGTVSIAHAASSKLQDSDSIGFFPSPTYVQHHPKVYLVFWGPNWENDTGTIATIEQTFQALAGSQYNNVLSQYTDSPSSTDPSIPSSSDLENGNYVHNDVELMTGPGAPYGRVIDKTTPPSDIDIGIETSGGVLWNAQIRHEADQEIAANKWSVNHDSQVIVFPQAGTTYAWYTLPDKWCGMHVFNTTAASQYAYALVQYGDQETDCYNSAPTIAESIAYTAVHEYAEMATDPVIAFSSSTLHISGSGWSEPSSAFSPQEVADLCEGMGSFQYASANGNGPFYLPYLWSNVNNQCVTSIGQEYVSPDTTYPSHGIHTVQGAILGEYQALGASDSVIGPPISEETPIGGGRVSYFTGGCGTNYPSGNCAAIYWSSGSGTHYVRNAEYAEYVRIGQAASVIGFPVSDDTAIGNGSVTYFNGTCGGTNECAGIYWSSGSGAHYVRGAEFDEYKAVGQAASIIGFPVSDDTAIGNGSVTYFNGTCGGTNECAGIYWSGTTGAHYVRGSEFTEYVAVGQSTGVLGFPLSDDTAVAGGSATYFQGAACGSNGPLSSNGAIYWSGTTGSHEIHGCIYNKYVTFTTTNGYAATGGILGFPVSDEVGVTSIDGTGGRVSYFKGGNCGNAGPYGSNSAIYYSGATGAHEVQGCIYNFYSVYGGGGPGGPLGFPITDEYTNGQGFRESVFQHGTLTWENGQVQVCLGVTC